MSVLHSVRWPLCPSNKLFEHDTFVAAETEYCRFQVQAVADLVIEKTRARNRSAQLARWYKRSRRFTWKRCLPTGAAGADADLDLLGAGVPFPDHLTIQTIETAIDM